MRAVSASKRIVALGVLFCLPVCQSSKSKRGIGLASSRQLLSTQMRVRGGSDPRQYANPQQQQQQQQDQYAEPPSNGYTDGDYDPSQSLPSPQEDFDPYLGMGMDGDDPLHETFQDRVDSWKQKQQEFSETAMESSRDDQGRLKLLTSVSRGSRATVFIILLFRNLHFYEVADSKHRGLKRLMLVTPVCLLFLGNLAGAVASFTSASHSAKKRLKVSQGR
jgi:hypothetical protein